MQRVYAWAIPANAIGRWADHTWVTTYDNRTTPHGSLAAVAAAGEHLWMCWGSFHATGASSTHPGGLLATGDAMLSLATCLVQSNADSIKSAAARGTVQVYGIDGVCHQVANQVLFATAVDATAPISVAGARGYRRSVYVYGQFGRNRAAWRAKVARCADSNGTGGRIIGLIEEQDDFVTAARRVLADRNDLLQQLLALRQSYQAQLDELRVRSDIDAEEIDRRHQAHFEQVADLIGHDRFVELFEDGPEEMRLVDPAIYDASRAERDDG